MTSAQYRDWWGRYEIGGLLAGQTPPAELLATAEGAGAIYASTRRRAQETAAAVAAGREVMSDAMFIEAPLPPPAAPNWLKLSPRWWGVVSRFWWHAFNHHEGQETRAQAEVRAGQAAHSPLMRNARLSRLPAMTDAAPQTAHQTIDETLSFEAALARLETIVSRLESGQAPLEESIALYEEGARLKAHCEDRLKAAQLRVDKIVVGPDGAARSVEPADFG